MLTQRQMRAFGLTRRDYGHMVIAQRGWAAGNPNAVYRKPLTMDEYLAAGMVADPLEPLRLRAAGRRRLRDRRLDRRPLSLLRTVRRCCARSSRASTTTTRRAKACAPA